MLAERLIKLDVSANFLTELPDALGPGEMMVARFFLVALL